MPAFFMRLALLFVKPVTQFGNMAVADVIVVFHHLVNHSVGTDFDNAVAYGLNELVVVRRHQHVALELDQRVVERLNRLKVEVVGRGVEDEDIGVTYEVECPNCGEQITFEDDVLEEGSIYCPACGAVLEFEMTDPDEEEKPEDGE